VIEPTKALLKTYISGVVRRSSFVDVVANCAVNSHVAGPLMGLKREAPTQLGY
jgi:hypothetical protein